MRKIIQLANNNPSEFAATVKSLSVTKLQQLIDKVDAAYYRPGSEALIPDAQYDLLRPALQKLSPNDPRITRVGCPYDPEELRTKVAHNIPMGSLDNTEEAILGYIPWLENVSAKIGEKPSVMVSFKADGASIVANYVDGQLQRVATRGNGEVGEDITANAVSFQNLPTTLPEPATISVRGEAILYKRDFQQLCEQEHGIPYDQIDQKLVSNPRNVGNGILGRDDGKHSDKIRFIAFNLVGVDLTTEQEKFQRLEKLGFKVIQHQLCENPEQVKEIYDKTVAARESLPYEIDGLVVSLNSHKHQDKFITSDPKTRLRPKYARAIKFPHKSNTTELLKVLLTVGHTGAIIPTAVVKQVRIGGVNVQHALLNNWDEIKRLQINIGDKVEMVLAGDIIPKIIRRVPTDNQTTPIEEPSRCPSCGEPTTRVYRGKKGANTYCSNTKNCPATKFAKVTHWVGNSKKGTGILGLGDTILKALWDNNLVNDPADLYTLTVSQIENVTLDGGGRIGKSRATEIVNNIQSKKSLPLHVLLGSLGIDLLGRRRVQLFQKEGLTTIEDWLDDDKLANIKFPGLGDTIRESIRNGIDENRELLKKLKNVGVSVEGTNTNVSDGDGMDDGSDDNLPLSGLSFCLTGTRAFIDDIERLGGTVKSGVSKGLDYLVQKDPLSKSNKTQKAEQYGTKIISVDYLEKIINGEVAVSRE